MCHVIVTAFYFYSAMASSLGQRVALAFFLIHTILSLFPPEFTADCSPIRRFPFRRPQFFWLGARSPRGGEASLSPGPPLLLFRPKRRVFFFIDPSSYRRHLEFTDCPESPPPFSFLFQLSPSSSPPPSTPLHSYPITFEAPPVPITLPTYFLPFSQAVGPQSYFPAACFSSGRHPPSKILMPPDP